MKNISITLPTRFAINFQVCACFFRSDACRIVMAVKQVTEEAGVETDQRVLGYQRQLEIDHVPDQVNKQFVSI